MSGDRWGAARAAEAAVTMAVMTLAGALIGQYLDRRLGTVPWLTLAGTMAGMAAGFAEVLRIVRRMGDGR
jgi:F0F1-type ATP synthase assembly protein I